jgi:hypothetical protein
MADSTWAWAVSAGASRSSMKATTASRQESSTIIGLDDLLRSLAKELRKLNFDRVGYGVGVGTPELTEAVIATTEHGAFRGKPTFMCEAAHPHLGVGP